MAYRTLIQDKWENGIRTQGDFISKWLTVYSDKRANKVGAITQLPYGDPGSVEQCLFCNPSNLEGQPVMEKYCDGRVSLFPNSAPFLPYDPSVIFVQNDDPDKMKQGLHTWQMHQLRSFDLYYLLRAAVERGREFAKGGLTTTNLIRMILGFNIGQLAGQSLPHIHAQYGWEVALDAPDFDPLELQLFYVELASQNLIVHASDPAKDDVAFKLISPWAALGQYAVDLYFPDKYEIHLLEDNEMRMFGYMAFKILQRYKQLGICNVNIILDSSPRNCRIVPVIAHFIPRVNHFAMYELYGRAVVDTPPAAVFNEMRTLVRKWPAEMDLFAGFDPGHDYELALDGRPSDPIIQVRIPLDANTVRITDPSIPVKSFKDELREIPLDVYNNCARASSIDVDRLEALSQ